MNANSYYLMALTLLISFADIVPCAAHSDIIRDEQLFDLPLAELLTIEFRRSLKLAREIKRRAPNIKESIVSEDIANFIDLNLAEAIQRVPGVAITRESGEGRQISLRGVGANFTRVHLNGMETLATSSSPMDSRNTLDNDRAFDFNIFASEMFSRIDIHKSYMSDRDEGGIGGSVELFTPKPFDQKAQQVIINGAIGDNTYTGDLDSHLSLLASNTWGKFGLLGSFLVTHRDTIEKGFNTTRWRARPGGPVSDDPSAQNRYNDTVITDPTTIALIENGDLWFSRSNRYSVWQNDQTRTGVNIVFQYQDPQRVHIELTTFFARLENQREEFHLGTGSSSSRWPGVLEDVIYQTPRDETEIVYAEYRDVELRSEHRLDTVTTTYNQVTLNSDWFITPNFSLCAYLGWSNAQFDQPTLDKVFVISNPGTVYTDFRHDRFYGNIRYDIDTTSLENWRTWDLYLGEEYFQDTFADAKLIGTLRLNNRSTVKLGGGLRSYTNKTGSAESTPQHADTNSQSFTTLFTGSDDIDWVVADVGKAHDFYQVNHDLGYIPLDNRIREETVTVFGLYRWNNAMAYYPLSVDLGLRYLQSKVNLENQFNGDGLEYQGSYNYLLPSLSSVLELNKDILFRLGASKNIGRPYLFEQRIDIGDFNSTTRSFIFNGDPDILDPFVSTNLDVSFEWYLGATDFFSATIFNKDITGFSNQVTETMRFGDTGLPASLLPADQDNNTLYQVTHLTASDKATIKGLELTAQHSFSYLNNPLKNLGLVGNITLANGKATYRDVQGRDQSERKSFPGLSKISGNITLMYELRNWGLRFSGTFRDNYISNVEAGLTDEDERGFHATSYVDFSSYLKWNNNLKITFDIGNLTDEREEQYSDSSNRVYNTTTSGTTLYLGVNYKL